MRRLNQGFVYVCDRTSVFSFFHICTLYFVFVFFYYIPPPRPCLRRLNPGAAGAHLSSPPLARLQSFLPEETTILIFYLFPVFLKLSPGFLVCLILSSCSELLAGNSSSFYLCGKCSSSRLFSLIVSIKVFKWRIKFFLRSVILLSRIFFWVATTNILRR